MLPKTKCKTPVTDLAPLAGLTQLTAIHLRNTQVSDLSAFANLVNLTTVRLDDTPVNDLYWLAGLPELKTVWLHNTPVSAKEKEKFVRLRLTWCLPPVELHG